MRVLNQMQEFYQEIALARAVAQQIRYFLNRRRVDLPAFRMRHGLPSPETRIPELTSALNRISAWRLIVHDPPLDTHPRLSGGPFPLL